MWVPIFKQPLLAVDHRLIWLLLSLQDEEGRVGRGWREKAMAELKIPQSTLWEAVNRLRDARIVICKPWSRTLRLRGEAFLRA